MAYCEKKNNEQELNSFNLNLEHLKPILSFITMIMLFFFAFHLADQALEKDHGGVPFVGWNFENTIIYGLSQAPSYGINEKVDIPPSFFGSALPALVVLGVAGAFRVFL